jgi:hypothetical protein
MLDGRTDSTGSPSFPEKLVAVIWPRHHLVPLTAILDRVRPHVCTFAMRFYHTF